MFITYQGRKPKTVAKSSVSARNLNSLTPCNIPSRAKGIPLATIANPIMKFDSSAKFKVEGVKLNNPKVANEQNVMQSPRAIAIEVFIISTL